MFLLCSIYLTILGFFGFVLNGFMVFLYQKQKKVTWLKLKGHCYTSVLHPSTTKIHIHFLHLTCRWTRNLDGFQEILHFQLRTEFNLLLMNLILCELLVVLIGIPADTIAAIQQGWDMGPLVCNVVGFCLTTLGNQRFKLNAGKTKFWAK